MAEGATYGNPAPGYEKHPDHYVEARLSPKWVRAVFGGETIADSRRALIVRERRHTPVYYFPKEDVRMGPGRTHGQPDLLPVQRRRLILDVEGR